jgi:peroxiredoxin
MASPISFGTVAEAFSYARDLDAPINDRLKVMADAFRQHFVPYTASVDAMVARLAQSGAGASAPWVGEPMPPFMLPDETGRLTSLEELLADGPVALSFHRGQWCPFCRLNTLALAGLQDSLPRGRIVAITPDRQRFAALLKTKAGAAFPVLTDIDNAYALALNLAVWLDDGVRAEMLALDTDIAESQGNDHWILPIPATFVVGADGIIAARQIDPDFRRRMDVETLRDALISAP